MRTLLVVLGVCGTLAAGLASEPWGRDRTVPARPPVPVVVELFTSEGCSSCPPADDLLARLQSAQPVVGADIIVLSQHVDYWNRLGWVDPFSSPLFSTRQQEYARALGHPGVYTPQVIVDGRYEAVGHDREAVRTAVTRAQHDQKIPLSVEFARARDGSPSGWVDVRFDAAQAAAASWLTIAITEDHVSSQVQRGENARRRLQHTGVVRHLLRLPREATVAGARETIAATEMVPLSPDWVPANLRAVAFLQRSTAGPIVGAGSATLRP